MLQPDMTQSETQRNKNIKKKLKKKKTAAISCKHMTRIS